MKTNKILISFWKMIEKISRLFFDRWLASFIENLSTPCFQFLNLPLVKGNLVISRSKKKPLVARSSAE